MKSQVHGQPALGKMQAKPSIASVTVVYNGASLLRQHLQSLKRQSQTLDEIVIVDNASTDDSRRLLQSEFPEVTLLALPENFGVGGGLAAGLQYAALEKKYDWVWIFDQDSIPSPVALERLLDAVPHLGVAEEGTAILAPVCLHPETQMAYPGLSWKGARFVSKPLAAADPITFVDMVISSGSLIRREAIEHAGLPREDFFMDFVDYEHCLRLRRHGFRIAVVADSTLDHAIGTPKTLKVLGRTKSWADHAPWREYYMTRNEVFTIWRYCPEFGRRMFVLYRLMHHTLGILFFGAQKLACFRMIWHGLCDGFAGRMGKRFLPGSEKQHSPLVSRTTPFGKPSPDARGTRCV